MTRIKLTFAPENPQVDVMAVVDHECIMDYAEFVKRRTELEEWGKEQGLVPLDNHRLNKFIRDSWVETGKTIIEIEARPPRPCAFCQAKSRKRRRKFTPFEFEFFVTNFDGHKDGDNICFYGDVDDIDAVKRAIIKANRRAEVGNMVLEIV